MSRPDYWQEADWPAPAGIQAGVTLRQGGASDAPYASMNLAAHVGDDLQIVTTNRQRLSERLSLPAQPLWLKQQHTNRVIIANAELELSALKEPADAVFTSESNCVCAVMTADCLPILLCDEQGEQLAAVHAGWRGLLNGIVENTLALFADKPLLAWLGPAISQQAFEVGDEVRTAFLQRSVDDKDAFIPGVAEKWHADLYRLASNRLLGRNTRIYGGQYCTYAEAERYFSYRRDGQTGRMASLIWRKA